MKYSIFSLLVILGLVSLVPAQIPTCAQSCFAALPSECGQSDIGCICKDASFTTTVTCCALSACNTAEINSVVSFAVNLCSGAGVTVATTLPSCPSATGSANQTASSTASPSSTLSNSTASAASAPASTAKSDASSDQHNYLSKAQFVGSMLVILGLNFV